MGDEVIPPRTGENPAVAFASAAGLPWPSAVTDSGRPSTAPSWSVVGIAPGAGHHCTSARLSFTGPNSKFLLYFVRLELATPRPSRVINSANTHSLARSVRRGVTTAHKIA